MLETSLDSSLMLLSRELGVIRFDTLADVRDGGIAVQHARVTRRLVHGGIPREVPARHPMIENDSIHVVGVDRHVETSANQLILPSDTAGVVLRRKSGSERSANELGTPGRVLDGIHEVVKSFLGPNRSSLHGLQIVLPVPVMSLAQSIDFVVARRVFDEEMEGQKVGSVLHDEVVTKENAGAFQKAL